MKHLRLSLALTLAVSACFISAATFAQNTPGTPDGILGDRFQLNEHPQMQFAASAPDAHYQADKPSKARKRGDLGDPNGCNLQCPASEF